MTDALLISLAWLIAEFLFVLTVLFTQPVERISPAGLVLGTALSLPFALFFGPYILKFFAA